jgi:RES domain-containing protein
MFLWRISNYATLDGSGGLHVSGRWHTKGHPILYCSTNPSTALLEILVHMEIDAEDRPENFQVLKLSAPNTITPKRIKPADLPPDWRTNLHATQAIGDQWLRERRSLLLEVPSILVPETSNLLVNPLHPSITRLKITAIYQHPFDARLFD